jgi:hypothetical protein
VSEVEAFVDVAIMYAVIISLTLLAMLVLLPGLAPR